MPPRFRRPPAFRILRRGPLFALILATGLTCRDRDPLAPGLPGRGALDVAPLFETTSAGGPIIELRKVRALLIRETADGRDTASADAEFEGDSAVLRFEVTVAAPSQLFALEVEALDTLGAVMFRGDDTVRVAPGRNPAWSATELRYVAPDTALRSLVLLPEQIVLEAGDSLHLAASGLGADAKPVAPVALGWTSRAPLIASVSPAGTVTAGELDGSAWIVARSFTGVTDSVLVTVRGGVAAVVISPDSAVTLVGTAVPMYAEALDAAGTPLEGRTVTWTSLDPDIASIGLIGEETMPPPSLSLDAAGTAPATGAGVAADSNGASGSSFSAQVGAAGIVSASVLGVAPGVARIVASAGDRADTATVRVESTAGIIARTEVKPRLDTLTSLGDTLQLLAASYATDGSLEPGTYQWIVRDPQIASVTLMGSVIALSNGETWAVVTEAGGTSDSARITVRQLVASVAISPFSARVRLGSTQKFGAYPVDGRGNAVASSRPITWQTESQVYAQIDGGGIATGTGIGEETVLASIDGVIGRALLDVVSPVERVVIAPDTITLAALGATGTWTATAYDSADVIIDAPVRWESSNAAVLGETAIDKSIATFAAVANGSAMVRATVHGVSASAVVRVQQQVMTVELAPATVTVGLGGAVQLAARPLDANGRPVAGIPAGAYGWAVEQPTVASGDAGLVRGLAIGSTNVTVSLGAVKSAPAAIDVSDAAPASIAFARDTIVVGVGASVDVPLFLSTPSPSGMDVHVIAGDTTVEVSPSIVRFDPGSTQGVVLVRARGVGTVTLQAMDSITGFAPAIATVAAQPTVRMEPAAIALTASDEVAVRVLLSEPAPPGGLELRFDGNEESIVAISPLPVIVPAGHLAADLQLRGMREGSITLVPVAAGVPGVPVSIVVADAVLAFTEATPDSGCTQCETVVFPADATATNGSTGIAPQLQMDGGALPGDGTIVLGAGQYLADGYRGDTYVGGLALRVPVPLHRPVRATIRSSDPTIVRADEEALIDSGRSGASVGMGGLRTGEATLVASAPGWADATQRVVVSTPRLVVCCDGERFAGAEEYLTVAVTDSLGREHPRISSLVVQVSSSSPDVVAVIDTAPAIAPGESSNWNVRVIAREAGTAWVKVRAGGHVADSVELRVTGGSFRLLAPMTIGESQRSLGTAYISLPSAASADRVFTLESSAASVLAVPASVTIRAGESQAYFDVTGVAPGSATLRAAAASMEEQTAEVLVTPRALHIEAHDDTLPVNGARNYTVYTTDSAGTPHTTLERVVVRVRARDEEFLITEPDTVVIEAGQYYATGSMRGLAAGSTRLRAQASSHMDDSTGTLVVAAGSLRVNDGDARRTIGVGQRRSGSLDYVTLSEPAGADVQLRISGARSVQVPSVVVIPGGATWAEFDVAGTSIGTDTLLLEATGFAPATLIYEVTAPRLLDALGLPATVPLGGATYAVQVRPGDAAGVVHATDMDVVVRVRSTNPGVLALDSTIIHIPAGATISSPATATFLGNGSAAVIFEDTAGIYAPDTSGIVTVTAPPLALASPLVALGMRQQSDDWEQSVSIPLAAPADINVFLASSDPRVAGVPSVVVIPAGTSSASFRITGGDATGTVQISARADGYHEARAAVEVGRPSFSLSVPTWSYTVDAAQPISVYATDHRGQLRTVTEDIRVALASSNALAAAPDSAAVTIRAGTYGTGDAGEGARLVVAGVGTAVISAADLRAGTLAYRAAESGVVEVRRPAISLGYEQLELGLGQYASDDLWVGGVVDSARTVTLVRSAPSVADGPASVSIPALESYAAMRLTGAKAGVDTLVATMAGYVPDTTIIRVDLGTTDLRTSGGLVFSAVRVGEVIAVRLHALGPSGNYGGPLATPTIWTLAAGPGIVISADAAGATPIDTVTVPADGQLSAYFYVRGVAEGTTTLTIANAQYRTLDRAIRVDP